MGGGFELIDMIDKFFGKFKFKCIYGCLNRSKNSISTMFSYLEIDIHYKNEC
jgi:hypothetical protein